MSLLSNALYNQISQASESKDPSTRLARVTSSNGSGVFLQFYGDDTASQKPFKRLDSYTPSSGDTVLVQQINGSFVITGKVV